MPTHTSVPMPIARSLRVARCHLSLGSRRHPVESGHAPADRSATWLRFRDGSIGLPVTPQRATALCRCVWTVRAPHSSSSRVRVLPGVRDRRRQARVRRSGVQLPLACICRLDAVMILRRRSRPEPSRRGEKNHRGWRPGDVAGNVSRLSSAPPSPLGGGWVRWRMRGLGVSERVRLVSDEW